MVELILKQRYRIESPISLDLILLQDLSSSEKITAKISELIPATDNTMQNVRENITDLILRCN